MGDGLRRSSALPTRGTVIVGLACALLVLLTPSLHADDAPLRPSPEGLTPGMPGTTVRMAAEKVDINLTERDGSVHALVSASFDMFNRGAPVNLTVGFPLFSGSFYFPTTGGIAGFQSDQIADFRASSGSTIFQPTVRKITFAAGGDQHFDGDWSVWQMDYPGGKTTTVQVSYDQTLTSAGSTGFARANYVLRTGALWDGTIGDATITMSSSTGGTFLSPDRATSATSSQVVWHLTDVKPTFDPSAYYVRGDVWQRLTAAEQRLTAGSPSASDYASAIEAFLDIGQRDQTGLPFYYWTGGGPPPAYADRYAQVSGWASQATMLDPTSAAAFEALGELEYLLAFPTGHGPEPSCRPVVAATALRQAVDLGSATAQAKLDALDAFYVFDTTTSGRLVSLLAQNLPECPSSGQSAGAPAPNVETVPDTLTDSQRADILSAVERANAGWAAASRTLDPSGLSAAVGGQELATDLTELDRLRRQGQTKNNVNTAFAVTDVTIDAPGHAIVRTHETWYAEVFDRPSGRLLQRTSAATYDETYTVEFLNGGWIVTRNDI